ncbi:hypothetical protein [Paucibacter sp. XJ19-41]|uniref:hypothetical protein n=1 Tax=Paucibacter sp. XJ19-41 TaxID=2927824 RepID=UPI00234B62C1|nr:hypothetical protein [Paucibacter sp. XJ19-41]MDC6169593.1 hypothetical protein [Paucibacter sp. XJ19-41]
MKKLCLLMGLLLAGQQASAQWTEKYPIDIKIGQENAVSVYLRANYGKVGEIAARTLDRILNDPQMQAKMAKSAIDYLTNLHNDPSKSVDEKAAAFLKLVDEDIGGFVSAGTGSLNVVAGFAARYNVVRLSWVPSKTSSVCQKMTAACNGASVPPGSTCYSRELIGGQWYDRSFPAPITITNVSMMEESEYTVYRNGRKLTTLAGRRSEQGDSNYGTDFSSWGVSFQLNLGLPKRPGIGGDSPVFYDYDPYQGTVGTPLRYEVVASANGCGPGYNNSLTGAGTVRSEIYVDANGDAQPDFYPLDELVRRREGAGTAPPTPSDPNRTSFDYSYSIPNPNRTVSQEAAWSQFISQLDAARRVRFGVGVNTDPLAALEGFDQGLRLCGRAPLQCYTTVRGSGYVMNFSITDISAANSYGWTISYRP